jgi:hypothetical protein
MAAGLRFQSVEFDDDQNRAFVEGGRGRWRIA